LGKVLTRGADRQFGVGACDEFGGAVLVTEFGEPAFDLAWIGVGRECSLDGAEALASIVDRRAWHRAQKLVATEADDHVIRAQMIANLAYYAPKQRVARGMAVRVVDELEADNVDIDSNQLAARSVGTIDLAVNVREACRPHACAGELVGLGDRELLQKRVADLLGRRPVTGRGVAVTGGGVAVGRGRGSVLSCRSSVARPRLAITQSSALVADHTPGQFQGLLVIWG